MIRTTSRESQPAWKLDLGTEVTSDGVRFRVWAPKRRRIEVMLEEAGLGAPLERAGSGYFAGLIKEAKAGMRYRYRLDGVDLRPDPCSRYQPEGPHGPSLIVDPSTYRWRDRQWAGVRMHGQVIYECISAPLHPKEP
jgi:maltooligosyltrehalose trehalohydrolase